jgi:hypothetical protein
VPARTVTSRTPISERVVATPITEEAPTGSTGAGAN